MSVDDALDVGVKELVAQTAEDLAIESTDLAEQGNGELLNSDGDPCNSYEWSIIFFVIMIVAQLIMGLHCVTLFKRRSTLSAFDVLTVAYFISTLIQFGPMFSQVLHSGHDVYSFSQTGCKLQFFTDYGMRNVITFLVVSFFLYAYLVLYKNFDPENLDGKMRRNYPWLIILMALIEGVFGMVPAMYVDVSPTFKHCVWTPTMDLSNFQIYSMELVIRPLTPYLIPALLLAYPLFKVTTTYRCMDEGKAKPIVFTILTITWSYFIMNLPYALVLVRETSSQILGDKSIYENATFCNFKWVTFLLHQSWFLLVPVAILAGEIEKGNKPVGYETVANLVDKAKRQINLRF